MKYERTITEEQAYRAAFARIVAQFHDGKISVTEKRRQLQELNIFYGAVPVAPPVSRETRELVPAQRYDDDEPQEYWWQK